MSVSQLKDFDQCCRCCLVKAHQLESLFGVHLGEMLSELLNVKVEINDGYPAQMCRNCIRKMTMAVNFRRLVLASYEKLTDIIKNPNNTPNNATDNNVIDFRDEEKQMLTVSDDNIKNIDKAEDLISEAVCNSEVVVCGGHEPLEHEDELLAAEAESAGRGSTRAETHDGHVCIHCGKWFKWRTSLNKHARTHDGRLFRCHVCGHQYADSYYLRIHERKHSSENGKPFACQLCPSRYADSNSLKRHATRSHPRSLPGQPAPERVLRYRGGILTCADADTGIVLVVGNDS